MTKSENLQTRFPYRIYEKIYPEKTVEEKTTRTTIGLKYAENATNVKHLEGKLCIMLLCLENVPKDRKGDSYRKINNLKLFL